MTLAELRAYLAEMTTRANRFDVEQNAESIAAQMWKHFTAEALTFWTTSGVLEHIAACLAPPIETDNDDDEEG